VTHCNSLFKFSEELQEDFIELVHNSAMKDDLKSSPIDVLQVVSSRNGTGNNGTNGKVGKMAYVFNFVVGVWSLKERFEVRILGLYLGFWSLGWGFELGGGCSRVGGLGWKV